MSEQSTTWDDVRRIADELELKIHLAGMEARDQWAVLKPRISELEKTLSTAGREASDVLARELSSIGAALRRLRDDVSARAKH